VSGPKTILHAVYGLGGKGAVAARALDDIRAGTLAGHDVLAITDKVRGPLPPDVTARYGGPETLAAALPGAGGELAQMAVVWHLLRQAARDLKPDAIVFHSSTLAWPAIAIARRAGARSVFVVQALIRDRIDQGANPYGRVTTALYLASNAHALRHSDRVACVSEHMASVARAEGAAPQSIRVVPNPIEINRFAVGSAAGRAVPDETRADAGRDIDVLFVGRLSREKGVDILLDAMRSFPGHPRLVIAGDGPLKAELQQQAAQDGTPAEFMGWVGPSDLPALVARAHVQVVPSRSEPQGVVVIEALATGTPVIGARVGGIPEMVHDGETGWLVAPNDPAALRVAISEALTDRERVAAMRDRARRSVEQFSVERLPETLEAAYLDGLPAG
jgi:glycosyltransferase involved in cell wall biosynthesis